MSAGFNLAGMLAAMKSMYSGALRKKELELPSQCGEIAQGGMTLELCGVRARGPLELVKHIRPAALGSFQELPLRDRAHLRIIMAGIKILSRNH